MTDPSGHRERRPWTEEEDRLLRLGIEREDPTSNPPTKWHAIANHVPNRTNKDCRKRWWAQMATTVAKGGWSADEDDRLCAAVEEYGTKWALVAKHVQTRNSGQCAKRWNDALNPAIDRSEWTEDEDFQLVEAVKVQGKSWTNIVRAHLPGRTGLAAKNRYNHLTRASADRTASGRERRKSSATSPYGAPRHVSAVPPSSAASTNSTPPRSSRGPSPADSYHSSPYAGPGGLALKKEDGAYALGYAPDRRHHALTLPRPSEGMHGGYGGHPVYGGMPQQQQQPTQYGGYHTAPPPSLEPHHPAGAYGSAPYFPGGANMDSRAPYQGGQYAPPSGAGTPVDQFAGQGYMPPAQSYRYGGAYETTPPAGIKHADGYPRGAMPQQVPSSGYEHRLPPLSSGSYEGPNGQPIKQEVAGGMVNTLW